MVIKMVLYWHKYRKTEQNRTQKWVGEIGMDFLNQIQRTLNIKKNHTLEKFKTCVHQ